MVVITVDPVPAKALGAFNGLADRDTRLSAPITNPPGQKLQGFGGALNLNVTATGAFTGTLKLEGKSHSLPGRLDTHGASGYPTTTVIIRRGAGIPNLTLNLTIHADTAELTGTLTDGLITPPVNVRAWRNPWLVSPKVELHNPATALATKYTAALTIADRDLVGDSTFPQGRGYGTLTISPAGIATLSGMLADGTSITQTTTTGPHGEIALHWMLYGNTGSAQGWMQATEGPSALLLGDNLFDTMLDLTQADPEGQPWFDWCKKQQAASSKTLSYKGGFALHKLVIAGSSYDPAEGQPVLGLPVASPNAKITFRHGGIETSVTYLNHANGGPAASLVGRAVEITALNDVVLPSLNPAAIGININTTTGALTGSFTLVNDPDPTRPGILLPRKVNYTGLLIPRLGIGVGQYQLPELPSFGPPKTTLTTSPKWSGEMLLEPLP